MTKKIFLTGYMCVGKTTIGNNLARKLNLPFVDTDLLIENYYQKKIIDIFEEKGEKEFRKIEQNTLQKIAKHKKNMVISTGGGTPCFFQNMELMNISGITVYLKISTKLLTERLINKKHIRPLIKNKNSEEIECFVSNNLLERELFYNQASVICHVDKMTDNDIVKYLVQKIQLMYE
ncbi:MAG: shikimate kinase [Bacteroidales bacterium OttesenSCG-928-I14]|jgi:shikimate kinase|nr:shikimate kinase [Bacteroidales bacterium OttesenSCG-928-I14]